MEISVSDVDEDDLMSCAGLYVTTFREQPWNEEWNIDDAFDRLNDFLATPKSICIKAISKNKIRGFLFGDVQQWNGSIYYYLKEACVGIKDQRKGIGRALIAELESVLIKRGVSKIYLITQRDSIPSLFYSGLGFSENKNMMVLSKDVDSNG